MTGIVVDASAAIEAFRGAPGVQRALLDADTIFVSAVVVAELWFGALNSTRGALERQRVEEFLGRCEIVNVDSSIARSAAGIRHQLQQAGRRIPQDDPVRRGHRARSRSSAACS